MGSLQPKYWFECVRCGNRHDPFDVNDKCSRSGCGGLLIPRYDIEHLKSRFPTKEAFDHHFLEMSSRLTPYPKGSGVWWLAELLMPGFPVEKALSSREGHTDMEVTPQWHQKRSKLKLLIKHDGLGMPTSSFKDRGMTVAISKGRLAGKKKFFCASTGDTSDSNAHYTAHSDEPLQSGAFVPAEDLKIGQMFGVLGNGSTVLAIEADFDTCMKLMRQYTDANPDVLAVNSVNPDRLIGQMSALVEIYFDNGCKMPNCNSLITGGAGNLSSYLLGYLLLKDIGVVDEDDDTIFIAAQSEKASPIVRSIKAGFPDNYEIRKPENGFVGLAAAAFINEPVSYERVRKLYQGGRINLIGHSVTEKEIADTRAEFDLGSARLCPQGAVSVAALRKAIEAGDVDPNGTNVAVNTAHPLKFTEDGIKYLLDPQSQFGNAPIPVAADLDAIDNAIHDHAVT